MAKPSTEAMRRDAEEIARTHRDAAAYRGDHRYREKESLPMPGGAAQDTPQRPIERAQTDLDSAVLDLEQAYQTLTQRLNSVLTPQVPQSKESAPKGDDLLRGTSDVLQKLATTTRHLRELRAEVHHIIDRLEI